jgi:hypothetical protein
VFKTSTRDKTNLGEMGLGGIDWIGLAQDRDQWKALVNAAMNLRELLGGCTIGGLSSSAQLHRVS